MVIKNKGAPVISVNDILLCQPDEHRGCSICCGLFNFTDISRRNIAGFLEGGASRLKLFISRDEENVSTRFGPVRDVASHICPYQGFAGEAARPVCLLHPRILPEDHRDRSLFGADICGKYVCPAHYILGDQHKKLLLEHVNDWYAYSVAITDPETLIWILDTIRYYLEDSGSERDPGYIPEHVLVKALYLHARFLSKLNIPVFYYSVSEYNLHKHRFSAGTASGATSAHRRKMKAEIRRLLP